MKVLIETWARIEGIVEAETVEEAKGKLGRAISHLTHYHSMITTIRPDVLIRCYDLETGKNLEQ